MIYLLTVQGKDQIGLVEALAKQVEQQQGNWLESRLCRLEGQFAGIVRIEFAQPPASLPVKVESLTCQWEQVSDEGASAAPAAAQARISILAADRPGLVKQIAHLLVEAGANVEEIESRVHSAPFSGEQMFQASCLISLAPNCDKAKLAKQFESLAEELMCDIDFKDKVA